MRSRLGVASMVVVLLASCGGPASSKRSQAATPSRHTDVTGRYFAPPGPCRQGAQREPCASLAIERAGQLFHVHAYIVEEGGNSCAVDGVAPIPSGSVLSVEDEACSWGIQIGPEALEVLPSEYRQSEDDGHEGETETEEDAEECLDSYYCGAGVSLIGMRFVRQTVP